MAFHGHDDGRCHSTVQFGDDYGDNSSTFHCELPANHDGKHQESGKQDGKDYVLQWAEPTREYTKKIEKQMAENEKKWRAMKIAQAKASSIGALLKRTESGER